MSYWQDRVANSQTAISNKNIKQIEKQLKKYYGKTMNTLIADFESTYNKLLATVGDGKQPTPADLYKLDKYWQLQGQLRRELQKLGDKQISALSKIFEINFFEIYYSIEIEGAKAFTEIDKAGALQIINSIWVADGKSWSQRIWEDTSRLQQALNDNLVLTVAAGKKTSDLKKVLQEQFNVSYNRADSIVRTEIAHIQTQAAQKRYESYGIKEVQVWADEDERRCPVCGKLHEKKFPVNGPMPVPVHPRCRCCVIPVVE